MRIQGSTFVHGAQPINAPHRTAAAAPAVEPGKTLQPTDELTLSPEATRISQMQGVPDIRADRVAQLRAQIAAGTYETAAKLDAAVDRLLDEMG